MANNMFGSVFKDLAHDLSGTATLMQMIPMAAAGIGVGLAAISGISVKMASDFDQQMARIAGLTDTSSGMLAFYKKSLLELSPQLDLSATDAAKA